MHPVEVLNEDNIHVKPTTRNFVAIRNHDNSVYYGLEILGNSAAKNCLMSFRY